MLPLLTTLSVLTSWYGPGFHGNLTANGERYNQNGLTAAHKTLPFGTRLKVCLSGVLLSESMTVVPTFMVGPLILVKVRLMLSVSLTLELGGLK
jgi:hypothetical protein